MDEAFRSWVDRLPKIELHIHLEGSIPLPTLWELVKKYGGKKEVKDIHQLEERFVYRDFMHFLQTWLWKNTFIREYDDFTFIAEAVAESLKAQNILYAEMHFSPVDFQHQGVKLITQRIAEAIRKGFSRVQGIDISLIGDPDRNFGGERALRTVYELSEVKSEGVIGIGLGGAEKDFPPRGFVQAFQCARERGFHLTAHAGEAAGNESIREAIELLKVERIGHGTHLTDPALIERIGKSGIGIELCPISNLKTRSITTIKDHPARKFLDAGLLVSVNTDDPAMFGNSLCDEFETLAEYQGFTEADVREVMQRTVESSFLPKEGKDALRAKLG